MNEERENGRFDPADFIPAGAQPKAAVSCELEEPPRGSALTGILGALFGALVGVVPWFLASTFADFFVGWLGFLVGVAACWGYRLFKGRRSTRFAMATVIVCSLLALFAAEIASWMYVLCSDPEWQADAAWYGIPVAQLAWESILMPENWGIMAPSMLMGMVIGVLYGGIAGYFGGKVDNVMMRIVDIIIALPSLLYTILLMMLMGSNVRSILIALCLSSWVGTARITRSQVVSLKHQEYALAAKLAGASDFQILLRHLLPNAMGPIIVSVMFLIPGAIFSEAFLSFLGIGIQKPMASWGSLANDAIGTLTSAPYQMFFPIAAISLTMFSLNFIGDGLRDALDPKLKK